MSDVRLGILHLTDLHVGQPGHANYFSTIRSAFMQDLEQCHKKCGPWDLVIFSGDLAFSGEKQQFEAFDNFIKGLYRRLDTWGSKGAVFLAVPGNHDLHRPSDPTDPVADVLRNLTQKREDEADKFWSAIINDPRSSYRRAINSMFKEYSAWWKTIVNKVDTTVDLNEGIIPGDFQAILTKENCKFSIIGLNTAFLQVSGGDFRERLGLHPQQLQRLKPPSEEDDWLGRMDAAILVTHHPPNWLAKENREEWFEPLIDISGRFALHLCGHEHIGIGRSESRGGSRAKHVWLGRSLEAFDPTDDGSERTFGYEAFAITIDQSSREGSFQCWPRRAEKTHANQWQFGPDSRYDLEDEGTRKNAPEFRFERPNWKHVLPAVTGAATAPAAPSPSNPDLKLAENVRNGIAGLLLADPFLDDSWLKPEVSTRELFVPPRLSTERDQGPTVRTSAAGEPDNLVFIWPEQMAFEQLIQSTENYVVSGAKECGKSILGHLLAYDLTNAIDPNNVRLALYIDYSSLPTQPDAVSNLLKRLLYPNERQIDERLFDGRRLTLIFDNFAFVEGRRLNDLTSFFAQHPDVRYFLLTTEFGLERLGITRMPNLGMPYKRVFLHHWTRKEVRSLITRRYKIRHSEASELVEKVLQSLLQMQVPVTPLNVVLCIQLLMEQRELDVGNRAAVLEGYINRVLTKTVSHAEDGEKRNRRRVHFLLTFAEYLAKTKRSSIAKTEFEQLIAHYVEAQGIADSISDFIHDVMATQLITEERLPEQRFVKFKHDCVRQFYGGLRMVQNRQFFDCCTSEEQFLRFRNELLVAAGKGVNNEELLTLVQQRIVVYREALNLACISDLEDIVLSDRIDDTIVKRLSMQLEALRNSQNQVADVLGLVNENQNEGTANDNDHNDVPTIDDESDIPENCTPQRYALKYIEGLTLLTRLLRISEMSEFSIKHDAVRVVVEEWARLILHSIVLVDGYGETTEGTAGAETASEQLEPGEGRTADVQRRSQSDSEQEGARSGSGEDPARRVRQNGGKLISTLKVIIPLVMIGAAGEGCSSPTLRKAFDLCSAAGEGAFSKLMTVAIAATIWPTIFLTKVVHRATDWKAAILGRRIIYNYVIVKSAAKKMELRSRKRLIDALLRIEEVDNPGLMSMTKVNRDKWRSDRRVIINKNILKLANMEL